MKPKDLLINRFLDMKRIVEDLGEMKVTLKPNVKLVK